MPEPKSRNVILIHGAWAGGWVWDELLPALREAGYRQRNDSKELALIDADNDVEFFYLRPRDIALYVGEGTLDVGITGRDLLLDSRAHATEVMGLGFGRSRFHFAGPVGVSTVTKRFCGCLARSSMVDTRP